MISGKTSAIAMAVAIILVSVVIRPGHAHDYNWGKCPNVKSFDDFDIEKFLGRWYVIMKTSTSSECVRYNFTKTWNGNVQIEQTMRILTGTPVRYIGDLEVVDRGVPSKMRANFPLNYGTASYNVVWTDYNQAIIFSCQDMPRSHRQSVSILSRDMFPTKSQTNKIYDELRNSHLDTSDLSHVSHEKCPLVFDDPLVINRETLSTRNFASLVRKGGEKLGDLIEYTATKVRSLFGSENNAVQSTSAADPKPQDDKANIMTSSNVQKINEISKVIETNKRDEYEIFNQIENDAEWL